MPATQLVTGHRGGQQHTGLGLGVLLKNEGGERAVQRAQPATTYPIIQLMQQFAAVGIANEHRRVISIALAIAQLLKGPAHALASACCPMKSWSSCSINCRGGLSKCTPCVGA
ncbi:hypothetical protein D3C71_1475000 [compost metagenome]